METGEGNDCYVVPVARVRFAVETLISQRVHEFFPAYLALRREATLQGRSSGIEAKWSSLSDFLRLADTEEHLRPFCTGGGGGNEWLNKNLAGSYAPGSLRRVPLLVVGVTDAEFRLRDHHAELALEHLLFGERLPALAVAAFFLRDFSIEAPDPSPESLISAFGYEFGYRAGDEAEFTTLFDVDWRDASDDSDWLTPLRQHQEEES